MESEIEIFKHYVKKATDLMDPTADPCEYFFIYSGGKFKKENCDIPLFNFDQVYEKIIQSEEINFPSLIKARKFYKSCKNEHNFRTLLQRGGLYEEVGGWPALDKNWSSKNFDWIKIVAKLASMGLQTVIKHQTEFSENETIVTVSARKPKSDNKIPEVLAKLGVSVNLIPEIIGDIDWIEKQIRQVPPMRLPRPNCVKVTTKKTFENLREKPEIEFDYIKYFETYQGKRVEDSDICYIDNDEYFKGFTKVFADSEARAVANYIFFLAGVKFLKSKFPINLTIQFFAPTLTASGYSIYFDGNDKTKHDEVISRFLSSFEKIKDKFSPDAARQVKSYSEGNSETQEFRDEHFQQNSIESMYETLEISSDNFSQNIKNLQAHGVTAVHKICFSHTFDIQNNYRALIHFLRHATFNHNKPILHQFIGNGFRMWRDIMYSFTTDSETLNKYPDEVFKRQIIEHKVGKCYNATELTRGYTLALHHTLLEYKSWLNDNAVLAAQQDDILKGFGLTINKLFFISFAQREHYKLTNTKPAALIALLNNKQFTETFQCKLGSRMNRTNNFLV